MTTPVMTVSGVPSARVARACPMDSRMTLPPPKTASSPAAPGPPERSSSISISRSVSASRMRSPVVGPNRSAYAAREISGIEGTSGLPAQSGHHAGAGERDEFDVDGDPGLEAHGGARGDVQPLAVRCGAVEVQAGVGLGEVVVGADLDGAGGGGWG